MRRFVLTKAVVFAACLALMTGTVGLSLAEETGMQDDDPANVSAPSTQSDTADNEADKLDSLFAELLRERDPKSARQIADRIAAEWSDSGSATGNLLMQWASEAMAKKKNGLALDLLDQVTVLWPDYAEGWNRRATLHYIMKDFSKSMADINRVLALEPRHFGALAGMAAILERSGRDEPALRAWEQLLTVFPTNRQAQSKVGELADKLTGQRT